MRGLGQGGSLGLNDELSPGIAGLADKATQWLGFGDQTGIPREYAAGSAYNDMRNTERRENQESADKFPGTYRAGQIAGGVPSSIAMSGLGAGAPNLAARIASGGLAAGARGGIEGAGLAEDGNKLEGAARAAGPSAALGMAGAAAPAAFNAIKNLFKGGPPSGPLPALATAGAGAQPSAQEVARGAQAARGAGTSGGPIINRALGAGGPPARTVPPPSKGGRAKPPTQPPDEEHIPYTRAIPPPASEEALEASSMPVPKKPEPIEFMRKYKVDWGPNHGEKLGPPELGREYRGQAAETEDEYSARILNGQDPLYWQARGGAPARTAKGAPRALTGVERIAKRGPSMHEALVQENSPEQLAGLPKLDSEYAEAARAAPDIREMQYQKLLREEAATARNAALRKQAELNAKNQQFGELDLDSPVLNKSANAMGEYKLDTKPASGSKKTDVKKLMKKRPDDSDD